LDITGAGITKLVGLGLSVDGEYDKATQSVSKVVSVVDDGRVDDTYCFTEEKRHMGVFNGMLTGQCLEILLPASPMNHFNDPDGEIFLCTLANVNMGTVKIEDLKRVCYNTVRYLDDILDYQDYPTESARFWATKRRALGIGINNYAYWLARQGLKYGEQEALEKTHEYMEAMQYWLIDASVEVAKEKGRCDLFGDTKYSQGILPCDEGSYKADVDSLGDFELYMDWEALREKVKEYGMRNSTLSAIPPSETSSQVIKHGATNSLEQPRALITRRSNKDLSGKTLVPELARLKNKYDMLWEHASPEGYLLTVAVVQKWVDQSISANFSYNPRLWPNGDIPMSQMIRDLLMSYKYGVKTGYYHNTNKESGIEEEEDPTEEEGCEGGGCNV
jgi:ribonucleoside-diphosphate reductase alpha chain